MDGVHMASSGSPIAPGHALRAIQLLSLATLILSAGFITSALLLAAKASAAATPAAAAKSAYIDYSAAGSLQIDSTLVEWTDTARSRTLPLRIVMPRPGGAADTRLPVIMFSHGLGGSREAGRAWGDHWASHGYLVIHLQHPGSDSAIWQGAENKLAVMRGVRGAMTPEQFIARIADVKFVLDELERRGRSGDPIARRADLSRVGMSGHSYGAVTTQAIAGERFGRGEAGRQIADKRVRASIAFSPSGGRDQSGDADSQRFADIHRPFLSLTGSNDTAIVSSETAQSRQIPFERMPGPDKYLLVLDGADHMTFSGQRELRDLRVRRQKKGDSAPGSAADNDATSMYPPILAASLAFWNAYLKNDSDARRYLDSDDFERHLVRADIWKSKQAQ